MIQVAYFIVSLSRLSCRLVYSIFNLDYGVIFIVAKATYNQSQNWDLYKFLVNFEICKCT